MQLIGSITSPFVRKVRIVLAEKKLDYQLVKDDVWSADNKVSHYNPLGKVPCLVTDNQDAIYDSRVIVDYLNTLSPVGKLIPPPGRALVVVKAWEALADGLLDAAILVRLEQTWPGRSEEERSQAWIDYQLGKVTAALAEMASGLGSNTWLANDTHFGLADVAAGCALAYLDFRFPQLPWRQQHENLAAYLDDRLMQRDSFFSTAPQG